MRFMELKPVRPLAPAMVKKGYESLEKEIEQEKNLFYFTIRAREDDRLLGKALLEWIDWTNGNGFLRLGIGSGADRDRVSENRLSRCCCACFRRVEPVPA
jgi:hypothetical protein